MKLYDPDKCDSFQMQFGFEAPTTCNIERNIRDKIRKYEDKRRSRKAARNKAASKG